MEEETLKVKQGNPFAAAFQGTLGEGCGCLALIVIVFIVIGLFAAGGSKSNNPSQNTAGASPTPRVATKVTARELADAFDENQVAAEANWGGKYVEFSAKITHITDSGLSFTNVASKDYSLAQISCRIKDKEQILAVKNGQTVTVRGVVGKQMIGVIDVSECEIVQ